LFCGCDELFDERVVGVYLGDSWQFGHQVLAEDRAGLACAGPVICEGVDHKPEVVGDSWGKASGTGPIERCERRNPETAWTTTNRVTGSGGVTHRVEIFLKTGCRKKHRWLQLFVDEES
jgi:hypothetical protein